ncbi:MAG: hypothetical protein WCP03_01330 [Candidatus Saccharibacteria bacterium]
MKKLSNKQVGETIVEVLLAIAVLGLALGGAYAIANRSKNTMQANQERYQAQLYANGQADSIKRYVVDPKNKKTVDKFSKNTYFCITQPPSLELKLMSTPPPTIYPSECRQGLTNWPDMYSISVKKITDSDIKPYKFFIEVSWDSLVSSTKDKVNLVYGL